MRKYNFKKDQITDEIRKWENVVVLGTINGQQQLLSTTDEHSTARLLENVERIPASG